MLQALKQRAREFQVLLHALYLASRDPRVPWPAKAVAACVVAYALSPVDLIPDFIPVLGYLDDLILVPLGITLALRLISHPLWVDCLQRAREEPLPTLKQRWAAAVGILVLWIFAAGWVIKVVWRMAEHWTS